MDTVTLLIGAYVSLNIFAFLMFFGDKRKARQGRWRTSESSLLLSSLIGPFGAYGAMKIFRHKTHKLKFKVVPIILIAHVTFIVYIIVMA